ATDGDTIRVHAGTHYASNDPEYNDVITVRKSLAIIGNGTDETIIVGNQTVIRLHIVKGISLQGLHIIGNGTGIMIDYASEGILDDILVTDCEVGLMIEHGDGNRISNSTFIGGSNGVLITHGANENVFLNVVCRSAVTGLSIIGVGTGCVGNEFSNCTFDGNGMGASLTGAAKDSLFLRCSFDNNSGSGILLGGSGHVLESCTAEGNGVDGMDLQRTVESGSTILNCTIRYNVDHGISVWGATRCRFENLTISHNGIGIRVFHTFFITLLGCDIVMNTHGGFFENASMTVVVDCNISYNQGDGITFWNYSYTSDVSNCSLIGNGGDGIVIRGNPSMTRPTLTIRDNLIDGSGAAGIRLEDASNVTVRGNTIQASTDHAIITLTSSDNNLIHLNYFLNNTAHIGSPQGKDRYDNGSMGNYWDDYLERYPHARIVGLVWDTPYEVVKGSGVHDHYPLVFMREANPPMAKAGPDRTVLHGTTFNLDGSGSTDESPIIQYRWTVECPDGEVIVQTSTGPLSNLTFLQLGEHIVTLTVTDVWGNQASDNATITVVDVTPPLVDAGEDMTVGIHEGFTLEPETAWDLDGIVGYEWTIDPSGLNATIAGRVVEHTFGSLGTFMMVLRAWDGSGNLGEDMVFVHVVDRDPPVCDAGPDLVVDQGESVLLDGTRSTDNVGITTWNWSFDNDGELVTLSGAESRFVFHVPGPYTVTLMVWDKARNWAIDTMVVEVIDKEMPLAEAGPDQYVPQGQQVVLDGSASTDNVGIDGYRWTFQYMGNDHLLKGQIVKFVFAEPGVCDVTVMVWDKAGNQVMDSLVVTVLDTLPPKAVADGPDTIEIGRRVVLNGNRSEDNVGIVDHLWTFQYQGRDVVLSGANVEPIFQAPGNYEIILTVNDAAGNSDTDTIFLNVTPGEHSSAGSNLWMILGIIAAFVMATILVFKRRMERGT
ncbi:MAG: right-handed parallel beta-helix repeat-containing protein, partial [Candidatus Thermoplasmatota archaeon]|nr:right-handed parallel beta-helix repeat-containing protein [Candidatus Thermoplasmatota archaeon]